MDFKPIPKYPTSIKDISVLVESNVLIQDVVLSILKLKIDDLKDIDLFDVYDIQDNNKKSLSFHLIFRNENKTLDLEEIDRYLKLINENLTKLGYIIR
jgi:phenylalanyl-tRNA synthetase beta chain